MYNTDKTSLHFISRPIELIHRFTVTAPILYRKPYSENHEEFLKKIQTYSINEKNSFQGRLFTSKDFLTTILRHDLK